MRYRSMQDRTVSAYAAVLIITLFGAGATMVILHAISSVDFTYESQYAALGD